MTDTAKTTATAKPDMAAIMANVSAFIESILKNDQKVAEAKAAFIAAGKTISWGDLFHGKLAEHYGAIERAMATFFVVFGQACEKDYGLTDDQVISILVAKTLTFIPVIDFAGDPIPAALVAVLEKKAEAAILTGLLTRSIKFIEQKAQPPVADPVVVAYQSAAANTAPAA